MQIRHISVIIRHKRRQLGWEVTYLLILWGFKFANLIFFSKDSLQSILLCSKDITKCAHDIFFCADTCFNGNLKRILKKRVKRMFKQKSEFWIKIQDQHEPWKYRFTSIGKILIMCEIGRHKCNSIRHALCKLYTL